MPGESPGAGGGSPFLPGPVPILLPELLLESSRARLAMLRITTKSVDIDGGGGAALPREL